MPTAKSSAFAYLKVGLSPDLIDRVRRHSSNADKSGERATQTSIVRTAIVRGIAALRQDETAVDRVRISAVRDADNLTWIDIYLPVSIKQDVKRLAKAAGIPCFALVSMMVNAHVELRR